MKKILFALICAFAVLATGCQKENKEENNDLVGTKWVTEDFVQQLFHGGNPLHTYEFISNTEVDIYTTDNGAVVNFDETTTYDYNYPSLIIHDHDSDGNDCAYEYSFKDKFTIVRVGQNEYASYMKYTKVLSE